MPEESNVDPRQKEIDYYKKRVKQLSASYMELEHQSVLLNKDLLQLREGLKIISELQYMDTRQGDTFESFLEQFTEIVNIRMKMDVTLVLLPTEVHSVFHPRCVKAFSGYPLSEVTTTSVTLPQAFVEQQDYLFIDDQEILSPAVLEVREKLKVPYFILFPIRQEDILFGYLFVGRREQILQDGPGLMTYHLNTVEAICGVITAFKNQVDRNEILEVLVQKRTDELSKEKEKTESLLLNILPYEISQELKNTGTSRARDYGCVTVFFTDFKDFTKLSEGLTPQDLVSKIDYYYSEFDRVTSKYGMEKIKTIGDSYMCASGLPVEDELHAINAVEAAMEIRDFINTEKEKRIKDGTPYFDIRIGMHSGPVIAGIVGIKKFAYDIWGDTVNVASRMESACEVGKINISESTYQLVKDRFRCTYRGPIHVKNKGDVDMYFVEGYL